jgi:hypothetical protein
VGILPQLPNKIKWRLNEMRLKREMIWVMFKTSDADKSPTIEATFASPEAMARYFVNHKLATKHRLGSDGEIYPKYTSKQVKLYSLEEVKRKKKVEKKKELAVIDAPEEAKEDDETKEAPTIDLLEEERPETDEGDK